MTEIKILDLNRRMMLTTYVEDYLENGWRWITEQIESRFECEYDDIKLEEDPEGTEFLMVRGEPVAILEIKRLKDR